MTSPVEYEILSPLPGKGAPVVSIITTVYDRIDCLDRCMQSVGALRFKDYEQIVVADRPPDGVLSKIASLVADRDREGQPVVLATLKSRYKDWGITPASVGLLLARGKHICFLSDDNGYVPTHFDKLVAALDADADLGFAYSSCLYDGRRVLRAAMPQPGEIDLGQPLFRRELFERYLDGTLPFHQFGWDWCMIERFMQKGVRWKHLDDPTLIFRLVKYLRRGSGGDPKHVATSPPPAVVANINAGSEPVVRTASVYAAFERSADAVPLPRELAGYRDYHAGESILVCGCGSSLSDIVAPERFTTIAVNDAGRLFNPDYLAVVNPRGQFSVDRFRFVENSQARAIFTQLDLGISHPHIVRFRLGRRGGTNLSDSNSLPHTRNSPYVALCLALQMGAKRIGLSGVDFTDHHFFGATGRHPLAGELNQIDREYAALAMICRQMGVEVYNLSGNSRLTAFPKMSPQDFARTSVIPADVVAALAGTKVFFVNYRFRSCGEVFSDGLHNAAQDLAVESAAAYWDDCELATKIKKHAPDLLFVVHGRRYSERWKSSLHHMPAAVWLLDEPYEVDETSLFSQMFGSVFVNDPSTLHRHKNAHFLPVCYDPHVYNYRPGPRQHRVGFIGGGNPARELALRQLARRGLLSYTVGGPWLDSQVRSLCLSGNIPAAQTAELYRQTQIVVNVFRTAHHYNREQIPAVSMNPRIYEALACGALVISERRPEIERLCPEMPLFGGADEMVSLVEELLGDPARLDAVRKACIRRLAGHTYAHRLHTALGFTLGKETRHSWTPSLAIGKPVSAPLPIKAPDVSLAFSPVAPSLAQMAVPAVEDLPGWEAGPRCFRAEDEGIVALFSGKPMAEGSERAIETRPIERARMAMAETQGLPGGWITYGRTAASTVTEDIAVVADPSEENGLVTQNSYAGVQLAFDVYLDARCRFIAKVHQSSRGDRTSNSYHFLLAPGGGYIARHNLVLARVALMRNRWISARIVWVDGDLSLWVDAREVFRGFDKALEAGYCSVGVTGGTARVRELRATGIDSIEADAPRGPAGERANVAGDIVQPAHQVSPVARRAGHAAAGVTRAPGPIGPFAFTATPRRNLIYHVWPVRGSMWRWNIEQLKARLDLFNGRRLIGIVRDSRSEDPGMVQACLEGHGCDFLVVPNQPCGEVVTFPTMLRRAASTDLNEVTFYGHAKGVKHEPSVPLTVQRWAEVSYRAALDDWPSVRAQLERFALTGSFRMFGRFRSHRNVSDWHYSGTYFWLRHARVFRKNCFMVPRFYGGVEAWPGIHFTRAEAGCLLFDNLRELAYDKQFWQSREDEIARWEAERTSAVPPADLVKPPAFDGFEWPGLEQHPEEFEWLLGRLTEVLPRNILTIGAMHGGVEWHVARRFRSLGRDIAITVVELAPVPELLSSIEDARTRFGQQIQLVEGDSTAPETRARLSSHYDAVFIDGDHSYRNCRSDFDFALSLRPRMIGVHDIVDSDWHAQARCCVSKLWMELRQRYSTEERTTANWGGIGIVCPGEAET